MRVYQICIMLCMCITARAEDVVESLSQLAARQSSATADFVIDGYDFTKESLIENYRIYLKQDRKLSNKEIKQQIQKIESMPDKAAEVICGSDDTFMQRIRVIHQLRGLLADVSTRSFDVNISALQSKPLTEIVKTYNRISHQLTKSEMLTVLRRQIVDDLGFSEDDATQELARIQKKPLDAIRDIFTKYQKTLLSEHVVADEGRMSEIQRHYGELKSNTSLVRQVPVVRNVLSLLPAKVTNWTDQEVFEKIALKMKQIGFAQGDIDAEIQRLKDASLSQLQAEYPELHQQIVQRLYYFDTSTHHGSSTIKNIDEWLQQLHTWGTTAAMIGSYGLSAMGYDTQMLDLMSSFALFDPRLTFFKGSNKRDMLDMIYAQYASYDTIKHTFIAAQDHDFNVLTRDQLLQKIKEKLAVLHDDTSKNPDITTSLQKLSKSELEDMNVELEELVQPEHRPVKITDFEQKVFVSNQNDLLDLADRYLQQLKISKDVADKEIGRYKKMNIYELRTTCLDLHDALQAEPIEYGKLPTHQSMIEAGLKKLPRDISDMILPHVAPHIEQRLIDRGKSNLYKSWKMKELQHRSQDEIKRFDIDRISRTFSLGSLVHGAT